MNLLDPLSSAPSAAFFIIFLWSLFWKGMALWNASRNNQRNWFIVLLVLNTAGILEIVFLFYFSKNKLTLTSLKHQLTNIKLFR